MNTEAAAARHRDVTKFRARGDIAFWLVTAACCVLLCLSITNVSLWIDEGFTAWLVAHPTLGSIVAALSSPFQATAADRQYPLYIVWIWCWTRIFGSSEIALRTSNMPFAVLYVLSLALASRYIFLRRFSWIPFAFAPFIWFYMNEARSYLMLASLATAATAAAIAYAYGPSAFRRHAAWLLGIFALLTLLTNVLAVFLFAGLIVFGSIVFRSVAPRWREWLVPALVLGPPMALVIVFYAFTFIGGSGQNELRSNHRGASGIAYSAQILYEDFGFDGLGPPRNSLRDEPTKILRYDAASLGFGLVGFALAVILALRRPLDPRFWPLVLGWAASFLIALAVSYFLHTRFLGRHMAATFPLLMFTLMALLRYRTSIVLLAMVFFLSDIRLSLLTQYWKDDYRAAVRDVIAEARLTGCTIDWAADDRTANYYGLALAHPGHAAFGRYLEVGWREESRGVAVSLMRPEVVDSLIRSQLSERKPVCLALSKEDVFDSFNGWQRAISDDRPSVVARERAFTIFLFSSARRQ